MFAQFAAEILISLSIVMFAAALTAAAVQRFSVFVGDEVLRGTGAEQKKQCAVVKIVDKFAFHSN